MRRRFLSCILILLALAWTLAQPAPLPAETTGKAGANPRLVRLGDPFQIVLTITSDENIQIQRPAFPTPGGVTLGNKFGQSQQVSVKQGVTSVESTFTAQYLAKEAGKFEIGPFQVTYTTSEGESAQLSLDALTVEIYEDAPRPASSIILGKLLGLWKWILAAFLLAALAALVTVMAAVRRRKPRAVAMPIIPRIKSPEQIAYEDIRKLPIPDAGDEVAVKAYYDAVDDILRVYLNKRYNVATRDATRWELEREFRKRKVQDTRIKGVLVLLNDCDWVKFAKTKPSAEEIGAVTQRAGDTLMGIKPPAS